MRPFFITGTDTDCGKTYVTCQLLNYFRQRQYKVEALKPIASGCQQINGQWVSQDALALQVDSHLNLDEINPWAFSLPVSPHIAAASQNQQVLIEELVNYCRQDRWKKLDYLLIEGAGGLCVPLNHHETWVDFLIASNIPVILVVGIKLGCINHALLTENTLKLQGIQTIGWIANHIPESQFLQEREKTVETLKRLLKMPLIGIVPYQGILQSEKTVLFA